MAERKRAVRRATAGNEKPPLPTFERALVVSAHPDDPEFGFGASVAKLSRDGVEVTYVICTDGSQGGEDPSVPDSELTSIRYQEQRDAAERLGVKEVVFLGYHDGHLVADIDFRREITKQIRRFKPDLVMTHSPVRSLRVGIGASHPDHLAVGEATMCAVYPDARNPRAFRDLLTEGLEPHKVKEVWLPGYDEADHYVDATDLIDLKMEAIGCHRSQFQKPGQDPNGFKKFMLERMEVVGKAAGFKYAEGFRRLQVG